MTSEKSIWTQRCRFSGDFLHQPLWDRHITLSFLIYTVTWDISRAGRSYSAGLTSTNWASYSLLMNYFFHLPLLYPALKYFTLSSKRSSWAHLAPPDPSGRWEGEASVLLDRNQTWAHDSQEAHSQGLFLLLGETPIWDDQTHQSIFAWFFFPALLISFP